MNGPLGIELRLHERTNGAPPVAYIDTADQAKLIRLNLGRSFPGVTFSVTIKRFSGGSSVRVKWTDGPGQRAVETLLDPFKGGGFDGMIDMAYPKNSWLLPDGSVTYGRSTGTVGSAGTVPAYSTPQPTPDAVMVSFNADFVWAERTVSPALRERAMATLREKYGDLVDDTSGFGWGGFETPDGQSGYLETTIHNWPA